NMLGNNQNLTISMSAVDNFLMQGGDMMGNSVLIGNANMTGQNQNILLEFDIGGTMTLDGGTTNKTFFQIGPSGMSGFQQNCTIDCKVGKDLQMFGTINGTPVFIGPSSLTTDQHIVEFHFD